MRAGGGEGCLGRPGGQSARFASSGCPCRRRRWPTRTTAPDEEVAARSRRALASQRDQAAIRGGREEEEVPAGRSRGACADRCRSRRACPALGCTLATWTRRGTNGAEAEAEARGLRRRRRTGRRTGRRTAAPELICGEHPVVRLGSHAMRQHVRQGPRRVESVEVVGDAVLLLAVVLEARHRRPVGNELRKAARAWRGGQEAESPPPPHGRRAEAGC